MLCAGVKPPAASGSKSKNSMGAKRNTQQEKQNAKRAAAASVKQRKKAKNGKLRHYPPMKDMVDAADRITHRMEARSDKMNSLIEGLSATLKATTRHNTPPSSPQKSKKIGEIKSCDDMIQSLKQRKKEADDDGDSDEAEELENRIAKYKEIRRSLERSLFNE